MLALSLNAALTLMDERAGVAGTLGVLDLAARRGLVDLRTAFDRLRETTFHCRRDPVRRYPGKTRAKTMTSATVPRPSRLVVTGEPKRVRHD